MNARQLKDEINDFINQADERFLRLVYSMVESEKSEKEFFNTSGDEMVKRAVKSLQSIENGKTREMHEFKRHIESWKKNRTTK